MVQRLTYRRRLSYNTTSNKTRLSRTPGNRIVYLYTKKVGKAPKSACGICPGRLRGVRAVRPKVLMRLSKTKKHVSRAYGGSMCAKCLRDRMDRGGKGPPTCQRRLADDALLYLLTLAPELQLDYAPLSEALSSRFGSSQQPGLLRNELRGQTRRAGESLSELAAAIEILTLLTFVHMPSTVQEELARDQFVEAIGTRELQASTLAPQPPGDSGAGAREGGGLGYGATGISGTKLSGRHSLRRGHLPPVRRQRHGSQRSSLFSER
ncbi:60S ribosomal protein L34 [Acipenser ruthenus]|uniref:Large ribosomal subunit protein eL34 n=1 Tax=Acipenser ruthenus TaxID=7906 RepID=A0A444TZR4_ACIRT|nr:60S ribosomal protein L34 [Acipenser ruthenus]